MSAPRSHHHVPASYLKGFTPSGTSDDFLWVHDYEEKKSFRSKPDATGNIRDLYRFRSIDRTGRPYESLVYLVDEVTA